MVIPKNNNYNSRKSYRFAPSKLYRFRSLLTTTTIAAVLFASTTTPSIIVQSLGQQPQRTSSSRTSRSNSNSSNDNKNMSPSIKIIPNNKLHVSEPDPRLFGNGPNPGFDPAWTNENWLKSRFHFSFAEYSNFANMNYGVLRVMNDDLVQPHRGFGTHPHANMEIITYIVHGRLTHQDSMGTKESLGRGSVQFMTAGTGVRHSEFNHGDDPLRFIQTWIVPSKSGLTPEYGSFDAQKESSSSCQPKNVLRDVVSDVRDASVSTPVQVNQDVTMHVSELDLGQKVVKELPGGRQAYLLCIEGGIRVNGENVSKYDGCEISGGGPIEIEATDVEETENGKVAHFLMFTMKAVPGSGRSDV